jgi:hypothetical protein
MVPGLTRETSLELMNLNSGVDMVEMHFVAILRADFAAIV